MEIVLISVIIFKLVLLDRGIPLSGKGNYGIGPTDLILIMSND